MPLCGISNPQPCLQTSLIVTDSQLMLFFKNLFDVATSAILKKKNYVGVKLKPSYLNVLIASWLGFSGFGGVLGL